MAKVEMTRAEVAEAIRKERLTADVFSTERADVPPSNDCAFCAVGSVVRAAMAEGETSARIARMGDSLVFGWAGESRDPLMKLLSDTYEGMVMDTGDRDDPTAIEAGREAAVAWVMSPGFPDVVMIDIGDAKPRPGMKVVP